MFPPPTEIVPKQQACAIFRVLQFPGSVLFIGIDRYSSFVTNFCNSLVETSTHSNSSTVECIGLNESDDDFVEADDEFVEADDVGDVAILGSCIELVLLDKNVLGLSGNLTEEGCEEKLTAWSTKRKVNWSKSMEAKYAKTRARPKTTATTMY